jgi:hypothetical protein
MAIVVMVAWGLLTAEYAWLYSMTVEDAALKAGLMIGGAVVAGTALGR